MKKFSNKQKISLPMAVWLAEDQYVHVDDPMRISATALLKSTKSIILASRLPALEPGTIITDDMLEDISSRVPSAMGTALHNSIEHAWRNNYQVSMQDLGYPQAVIDRIIINPEPSELQSNSIPVYLETRVEKKLGPYTISGQFDLIIDGKLNDYKSTGVYGYMQGNNDEKYSIQGSIYRWLNPDLITDDYMDIQYIFTDWSGLQASIQREKGYPQSRVHVHPVKLMSIPETLSWLKAKLSVIHQCKDLSEDKLPACNSEELWRTAPTYKYFKNPTAQRATRNYDDFYEANEHLVKDGSIGVVKTVPGTVKACKFCKAFEVCLQKNSYIEDGTLSL
jgi:hypothetical protein